MFQNIAAGMESYSIPSDLPTLINLLGPVKPIPTTKFTLYFSEYLGQMELCCIPFNALAYIGWKTAKIHLK